MFPAMVKKAHLCGIVFGVLATMQVACAQQRGANLVEAKVDSLLARMTLEQKLKLVGGNGMYTFAIPEIGLHAIKMSDGPTGVRTWGPSTAYPAGIALAATWDPAMAELEGGSLAMDAKARGVRVLLAPGVNIYRSPMNGRNFEYFGEDPYLSSRMAVGYISGLQARGVAATVKHFDANNSEFDRHNTDEQIDERTLREIYLPAFEAAVKEAHVSAVMDAYNMVNGQHMTQNNVLNNDVLKKDWEFDGVLMSDWTATYDGVAAANGGLDLEMPHARLMTPAVLGGALKSGDLSIAVLDDHVRRILRLAVRYGLTDAEDVRPDGPLDSPEARKVAYTVAAESVVLLKNEMSLLPLDGKLLHRVAVIGPNVVPGVVGGGGSSYTTPFSPANLRDALGSAMGPQVEMTYSPGLLTENEVFARTSFEGGLDQEAFAAAEFTGESQHTRIPRLNAWTSSFKIGGGGAAQRAYRWSGKYIARSAGDYLFLVGVRGRDRFDLLLDGKSIFKHETSEGTAPVFCAKHLNAGQKVDVQLNYVQHGTVLNAGLGILPVADMVLGDVAGLAARADAVIVQIGFNEHTESEAFDRPWTLLPGQKELVETVVAANPKTVVTLNGGGGMDIGSWVDRVPALLHAWYGGEEGARAMADVLTGKVNPSGKLPISFERRLEDIASFNNYYPRVGSVEVQYSEGIFTGYRHFDRDVIKPLFPFGFGMSYTSFTFSQLKVRNEGSNHVRVTFEVSNTGTRAGDEVAQVYVSEAGAPVPRPVKELKAFQRVRLAGGQHQRVQMVLPARAFSYWDVRTHGWKRDPATFTILVGDSSASLPLTATISLKP